MALHLIPVVATDFDYTMGVTLDGVHYVMHVYWNDRDAAWYFDMLASNQRPIISGVKIVLGAYLGRVVQETPFTTGVISAVDTSGTNVDAGRDDLGTRILLFYIPAPDLLSILGTIAGA